MEVDSADFATPMVGSHRIQRIPKGSSSRHTSTVTLAILEEQGDFELDESELSERFTRGSGSGGQHRNTSDTCVVLTHEPTGETVRIDERSQWHSRQLARREMERRLRDHHKASASDEQNAYRRAQVDGNRAAKQFTHNDQRSTVVDHDTGRRWSMAAWRNGRW